ncbi:ABC transporter ATP-binding protein [Clostridium fermenticellae]|uniref:ABC transporter ATP-binding protein n=1 Tax=Clostridium fermenticellae TaxID=2068654 RepID=A0A386H1I2_9CLOT|nr:ABC transporter ATP-binding protein [Clostridium fermenticellae]AYD39551.1 ABC transporter ATP-binding protein [Clostridium fermenticellae]
MSEIVKDKEDYVVTLTDISLKYSGQKNEIAAIQDINLDIKEGEFICVLGPSGCGKSTLLKIIAGFLRPSCGEAKMDNSIISGPDWHRGVVFQSPTLYPWLNIYDNIAFGLKMRKFSKSEIKELTNKYIELVGLKGFEKHKSYELSGGMKQRASLARVLVNNPRMILMDEPFGALDALTRQNMQTLIRAIWTKTQNTVFLITHDVDEALSLATRVIVMSSRPGRIIEEFNTDFTHNISGANHGEIRYTHEYMNIREQILKIISGQSEEIRFS